MINEAKEREAFEKFLESPDADFESALDGLDRIDCMQVAYLARAEIKLDLAARSNALGRLRDRG